jgi:hypothetical protein
MKNLINFYATLFLPFIAIVQIGYNGFGKMAVILLFIWALIYHPLICGIRLIDLGAIKKPEIYKCFFPGYYLKHFSLLFFNKV